MKGLRGRRGQRDNSAGGFLKVATRERVARGLQPSARILEGCAGRGHMYRAVWSRFRGAAMDHNRTKAEAAARERPDWAVYCGDVERALAAGWMGHVAFEVVDFDPYGEPWKFLRALLMSEREWAPVTRVVLTDGYIRPQALVMAMPCKALFPNFTERMCGMTTEDYVATARIRIAEWGEAAGLRLGSMDTYEPTRGRSGVAQHVLRLEHG